MTSLSLAPIQGITTYKYRELFHKTFGGFDTYYSPFISTSHHDKISPQLFKDVLPENNLNDITTIPQLLGNKGLDFLEYVQVLKNYGYNEINWNIGCPYPTVVKKKKGSGILIYSDMIRDFLEIVCRNMDFDLTVKMRLGYYDVEEGLEAIGILNDYPIKKVILHGRTGEQLYTGQVDLDGFHLLSQALKHPLVYNGDIYNVHDGTNIHERFPDIGEFMLARGAIMNPFLPNELKGIYVDPHEKVNKIRDFHDGIFDNYCSILSGDKHVLDRMKEFWKYLGTYVDPNQTYAKPLKKSTTKTSYLTTVHQMIHDFHANF